MLDKLLSVSLPAMSLPLSLHRSLLPSVCLCLSVMSDSVSLFFSFAIYLSLPLCHVSLPVMSLCLSCLFLCLSTSLFCHLSVSASLSCFYLRLSIFLFFPLSVSVSAPVSVSVSLCRVRGRHEGGSTCSRGELEHLSLLCAACVAVRQYRK